MARRGFDVTAFDISDEAVAYAKKRSKEAHVNLNVLVGSFLNLPFKKEMFDFVFDFGCFHHVRVMKRAIFIKEVFKILKFKGIYFLGCFSYRNGPAWNHFTKEQIVDLFAGHFKVKWIRHVSSLEGDKVTRYFYEVLMRKRA